MSENRLTLTVAIPSYNKSLYIKRCIESILRDKKSIDEIILVDNASTDSTYKIAKEFENDLKCYKNDSNLGMSGNWNRCIELCKTDLLMIFHADDELLPGSIDKYRYFFDKYPKVGLVHADAIFIKNGDFASAIYQKTDKKEIRNAGEEAIDMPGNYCSTVIVKKEVYDNLSGFMLESCASDIEMWRRIGSKYDIGHIGEATVYYHSNNDSYGSVSLATRTVEEILKDWDLINKKVMSYYPENVRTNKKEQLAKVAKAQLTSGLAAVLMANIKAGKYKKSLKIILMIIFKYGGFFQLVKLFGDYFVYRFKKLLK